MHDYLSNGIVFSQLQLNRKSKLRGLNKDNVFLTFIFYFRQPFWGLFCLYSYSHNNKQILPMKTILTLPFLILLGFLPVIGEAQYITISGYITDFLTGKAVQNATVFEKSSGIGTITDKDGFYKLILKPGKMDITFGNNGFESYSQKFTVSADTTLMIKLKPEKWVKTHEKIESELQTGIENKKTFERKRFWFF